MTWMRRASSVSWVLSMSVVVMVVSTGCAVNPVSGVPELTLVSAEQEKQIGAEEAKKVEQQMGLLDDSPFVPYLNQLGQRLAEQSPRKDVTLSLIHISEPTRH